MTAVDQPALKLLPCPWCGGEAKLQYRAGSEVYNQAWWVECTQCHEKHTGAIGSNTWCLKPEEDAAAKAIAIAAWNTRTNP